MEWRTSKEERKRCFEIAYTEKIFLSRNMHVNINQNEIKEHGSLQATSNFAALTCFFSSGGRG